MRHRIINTFSGPFLLIETDDGELETSWLTTDVERRICNSQVDPSLRPDVADPLTAYFAGEEIDFSDIPTPSGSAFYRRCWDECREIPRGRTRSYGELAAMVGSPNAARAVGQAMRHNPLPIIVPCHRVIGSSGKLHGFAGTCDPESTPIQLKRSLLDFERECVAQSESGTQRSKQKLASVAVGA